MNYLRFGAILAVICWMHTSALAQMRGWEVGGWAGASNYFGDLNTNWRLNRLHAHGGIGARYNFNDRLAFKLGFNAGGISASDSDSKNVYEQRRNLDFRSLIFDGTAQFEFNFLPYVHGDRELWFTPYLFLGTTFFYFNPQTEYEGKTYNLRELGTEGQFQGEEYNTSQAALAYGFGFKTDLSYRWSINVELSGRRLFTDYLDDVSGTYADNRDIRAQRGEIAAALADRSVEPRIGDPGRQRGNGKNDDMYAFLNVGLFYYFGSIRCPGLTR
ncbi:MAG: outer membrane beta-barrel protein [Saprospiraceae bacterium]|nr:outer membrane beta-barrel protein [Saprospiraceae bacterium]MCC7505009.1 outer membrane beta-barrel protein [Saprospiraceae bacterium]